MMSSHTKTFGIVASIIFLCASVALVGALFFLRNFETTYVEKQLQLKQQKIHEQELVSLRQLVSESEEERAKIESYVLDRGEDEVVSFLSLIETLGQEQGIELSTPSLSEEPIDDQFITLRVAVIMKGRYGGVVHTISLLESLPYQSNISNVMLSKDGNDASVWSGELSLEVTKLREL